MNKRLARKEFKEWLLKHTKCDIQSNGWACGTCTTNLLDELGVSEDKNHNTPVDRVNEVWRGILQIRERGG